MGHPHTAGREAALQYLYMHDVLTDLSRSAGVSPAETEAGGTPAPHQDVQTFGDWLGHLQPKPDSESTTFAEKVVAAVIEHRAELDAEIAAVADNWDISRMAVVDRNILRLGAAELLSFPETTHNIVINEAVELAKRFSSEDAGAFVNGVLDKLRMKLRPETVEEASGAAEATPAQEG